MIEIKMAAWQHQMSLWRRLTRGVCKRGTRANLTFVKSTYAASGDQATNLVVFILSFYKEQA